MAQLKLIKSDPVLSTQGVWVPFILDIELLIGRNGTAEMDKTIRELTRPMYTLYPSGLPEKVVDEINFRAMAKHVLLGWKNIDVDGAEPFEVEDGDKPTDRAGVTFRQLEDCRWIATVPYSVDQAYQYLSSPEYYDLYRFVVVTSNNIALFRQKHQEAALGN